MIAPRRPLDAVSAGRGSAVKVMVVDDEQVVVSMLKTWLEDAGHEVLTRTSPFGSAQAILREQPDLVVLDLDMPGLTGDAIAMVVERGPRMPRHAVVLLSSEPPEKLDAAVRATGALGAIQKTDDGALFLAALDRMIATKRERSLSIRRAPGSS